MNALDLQLADLFWMAAVALRADYPLPQVLEQLAAQTPEPAAGLCKTLASAGLLVGLEQRLAAQPTPGLEQTAAALLQAPQQGPGLADALDQLSAQIRARFGSDGSLSVAMRELATAVGAALP